MNTKNPSESPVISCQSREQLRDASSIIRKYASDVAFIRDEGMAVTIQGLDAEALVEEYLMNIIMSSPSGSGLSEISSPLQLGWRLEASDIDASLASPTPTPSTTWLSLEDSAIASSNTRQEDEGYDADISSNCDHGDSAESV